MHINKERIICIQNRYVKGKYLRSSDDEKRCEKK